MVALLIVERWSYPSLRIEVGAMDCKLFLKALLNSGMVDSWGGRWRQNAKIEPRNSTRKIAKVDIGHGKDWLVGWNIVKCYFDVKMLRSSRRLGRGIGRGRGSMLYLTLHCVAITGVS